MARAQGEFVSMPGAEGSVVRTVLERYWAAILRETVAVRDVAQIPGCVERR